ncbi:hypothetical protein B0H65DRAFT_544766 [Neurospora tetraspora]|uniref:Uncharacterized protein n=1 Tax=Neurospora tetraspora TaxID=94610 RepID=A0AAE0MWK1_9PEZI|nr:hypothetical protein B0H65DRAFT_544766 [Neurospora tetraspora]
MAPRAANVSGSAEPCSDCLQLWPRKANLTLAPKATYLFHHSEWDRYSKDITIDPGQPPGSKSLFNHRFSTTNLNVPTPLVIVLFLSFFATFFGLTLLATSRHMHHAYKLGVLYVVDSVIRKLLDQAKALGQPVTLGAQDSPAAPHFLPGVSTQTDAHEDSEVEGAQQRLASYMKRLEEEQKKINDMMLEMNPNMADVKIAQSVVAMLQKQIITSAFCFFVSNR